MRFFTKLAVVHLRVESTTCKSSLIEGQNEICEFISPVAANALDRTILRFKPLFKKSPNKDRIYNDGSVTINVSEKMELLANEIPSLTFATGHDGSIEAFNRNNNINVRQKYLLNQQGAQWVQGRKVYEWRHNDLYFVAYPYLYRMYDDWSKLVKGEVLQ